jgi:hypothetical protein
VHHKNESNQYVNEPSKIHPHINRFGAPHQEAKSIMLDSGLLDGLSTEQLTDLRHRLNQTDESTTVLVPVGPKAFRLATLRLDQLYWGSKNHPDDDNDVSISKAQALQVLQDAISQRLPAKKVVEESEDDAGEHDEAATKSADPGSSSTETMSSAGPSSMPFIDIREEVDEDGKPIRTEAIDLTDHLQHLIEKTQSTPPAAGSAGPTTDPLQDGHAETDIDSSPRPMDGNEFEKLAARLDELALLEEEAAAGDDDDVPSKKAPRITLKDRLATEQGSSSSSAVTQTKKATKSGWSKGFLNNKPKSKQQPTKPKTTISTTSTNTTKPTTSATTKSVSFGNTPDQVHEIPPREEGYRRPVPAADPSLRQSRPIEPELFTGVVQERPRRPKPSTNAPAKEKKLSKFAQERQQGLL